MAAIAALVTAALLPGSRRRARACRRPGAERRFPGGERPGYLYLPPGFDPAVAIRSSICCTACPAPLSEYLDGTQLAGFADKAITDGRLRPFIAVMPAAGADRDYNGEWAGPWEQALIWTVDWSDANLPTIASADGRVLAGLSAGGFGAMDIGLRHPSVFGRIESWSGYFQPLARRPVQARLAAAPRCERPDPVGRLGSARARPSAHAVLRLERARAQPLVPADRVRRLRP